MMPLCTDIAGCEQGGRTDLSLDRKLILLGVGQYIFVPKCRRGADGQEVRPIDHRIRRRQRYWESLAFDVARTAVHKGRHELRWHRASIEGAKRGVSDLVEICRPFKGAIELSPTHTNTRVARTSGQGIQETTVRRWRISESDTRSKIIPSGRRQSTGNAGIAWKHPSRGRTGEPRRVQAGHQSLQLAILLRPWSAHIPPQPVVQSQIRFYPPTILGEQSDIS